MNTQPEALRLADELERWLLVAAPTRLETAAELRRLHALNSELLAALKDVVEDAGDCGCLPNDKWCPLRHAERVIAKITGETNG